MIKVLFFIFGLLIALAVPTHIFGDKNSRLKYLSVKQEVDLILVNTARNIGRESHSEMINTLFNKALSEINHLRKTNAQQALNEEIYFDQVVMVLNEPPTHCRKANTLQSESLVELLNKVCK